VTTPTLFIAVKKPTLSYCLPLAVASFATYLLTPQALWAGLGYPRRGIAVTALTISTLITPRSTTGRTPVVCRHLESVTLFCG
jgi:hypothetical protein